MSQIAKTRIEGEPVVDYDEHYSTLHISNPYFAFYLRWGRGRLEVGAAEGRETGAIEVQ